MRSTIFKILFVCAFYPAANILSSTVEDQKEQPTTQIMTEPTSDAAKNQRRHILDVMRKGVVMVKVKKFLSADDPDKTTWSGTGIIIDKARGLIVTNSHVAGNFSVCSYDLKFSNGSKTKARKRYVDPFIDFAILEVDPKSIPDDCEELVLSDKKLQVNDAVYVMGNAAGDEFTTQEGTIFITFDTLTSFNDQSFRYSGFTVGGASGSPILMDLSRTIDTSSEPLTIKILRDEKEKEISVSPDPLIQGSEN